MYAQVTQESLVDILVGGEVRNVLELKEIWHPYKNYGLIHDSADSLSELLCYEPPPFSSLPQYSGWWVWKIWRLRGASPVFGLQWMHIGKFVIE